MNDFIKQKDIHILQVIKTAFGYLVYYRNEGSYTTDTLTKPFYE